MSWFPTWCSDGDSVYTGELLRGSHFDDDVPPALKAQVARCAGCSHVERNPMVLCGDGQLVCAHLVGRVTVRDDSVGTHDHGCVGTNVMGRFWDKTMQQGRCDAVLRALPVMSISLMVRAAMLSVMSVAGMPSATASYAVSLEPWLYGLVSVQYTRFSRPRPWRLLTTPAHRIGVYDHRDGDVRNPLSHQIRSSGLTERCPVSGGGQRPGVAVCEDRHGVPGDARQDVLGSVVTDLPVVVDVTLQHVFDP